MRTAIQMPHYVCGDCLALTRRKREQARSWMALGKKEECWEKKLNHQEWRQDLRKEMKLLDVRRENLCTKLVCYMFLNLFCTC